MTNNNDQINDNRNNVIGIIVTFNPDIKLLKKLINAIHPQLQRLLIVDNNSRENLALIFKERTDIELNVLSENFGIAKAQNIGIERARTLGADYVLLLDQDSIPAPDMVRELLKVAKTLEEKGVQVAGVGPSYTDARQGETAAFVYLDGLQLRRRENSPPDEFVEADFLIASGCLSPMHSYDTIGLLNEDMFIDYVDIEWGLRARQQGYYCYGAFNAKMEHTLGDRWAEFRGRRIPVHSPLRHYYHFRNAVWLCRRPWLSLAWKIVLLWRLVRQYLFFTFLVPQGLSHAKMMTLGIWHGLINRMGRK